MKIAKLITNEVVFYMHREGYLPRSVRVKSTQPIRNFPFDQILIKLDMQNDKVWFTDKNGKRLASHEEDRYGSARIWWVTVKL